MPSVEEEVANDFEFTDWAIGISFDVLTIGHKTFPWSVRIAYGMPQVVAQ
jgi:hypothetical protein